MTYAHEHGSRSGTAVTGDRVAGKVAIITGAASGLGKADALQIGRAHV